MAVSLRFGELVSQERRQALSEAARSVGGGAAIGKSQVAQSAGAGVDASAVQHIRCVLQASKNLDPLRIQAELDLAAKELGLARCVDGIALPAMRQVHQLVAKGECDVAQDRMAAEAVRTWLNHRAAFAPKPQEIGPILLACGPRDRDTITLESLALLLRFQRWPCRVLGARVPTFTLTIAAQAADATGVVVISTESRNQRQAIVSLRAVDDLGIPVFCAGDAFASELPRPERPWRYLGTSIEGACTLLIESLAPVAHIRSAATHHR
jgi:hypothetical protein